MSAARAVRRAPIPAKPIDRSRELISLEQAHQTYGPSPRTFRRWIAQGVLPAYRIGPRLIRVAVTDLDRLVVRKVPSAADR